jgi:hypothetical protein
MRTSNTSKTNYKKELLTTYNINNDNEGSFLLQVDWIIENAVYPIDNKFTDNLLDLWNVYMPNLKLEGIVLEYANIEYPMISYIQSNTLNKFTSTKRLRDIAIKNYVKFLISQGETSRINLIRSTFDLFKNVSDKNKLYSDIDKIIELYFEDDTISQFSAMFLKRFQDNSIHIYDEILNRLNNALEEANSFQNSREILYQNLDINNIPLHTFASLINVLLCKIILENNNYSTEKTIIEKWSELFSDIPYTTDIYTFMEKHEKPYLVASRFTISSINDNKIIKSLYKDAVIFCAAIKAIENNEKISLKSTQTFWENEGSYFNGDFYLKTDFERIYNWLDSNILITYKEYFKTLHAQLLERIKIKNNSITSSQDTLTKTSLTSQSSHEINTLENLLSKKEKQITNLHERIHTLEIEYAKSTEKNIQIDRYVKEISELKEKLNIIEKEVLAQFISLLDSKNYNYILGKLYRIAYTEETTNVDDIRLILKNLFEVINISGIDIYGQLDIPINLINIKDGNYRVSNEVIHKAKLKYPGYKLGDQIILHPLVEEI